MSAETIITATASTTAITITGRSSAIPIAVITLFATTSAVSITDGLDGLLGGTAALAFAAYAVIAFLQGQLFLTIPPETQNGQRFRLAGQGMPQLNNTGVTGDLYATVSVILPTGLSDEERDLFRQLRDGRSTEGR